MTFKDEVNDRLKFHVQASLREGDPLEAGYEGQVAQDAIEKILEDPAVLREVSSEAGYEVWELVNIFEQLVKTLKGGTDG